MSVFIFLKFTFPNSLDHIWAPFRRLLGWLGTLERGFTMAGISYSISQHQTQRWPRLFLHPHFLPALVPAQTSPPSCHHNTSPHLPFLHPCWPIEYKGNASFRAGILINLDALSLLQVSYLQSSAKAGQCLFCHTWNICSQLQKSIFWKHDWMIKHLGVPHILGIFKHPYLQQKYVVWVRCPAEFCGIILWIILAGWGERQKDSLGVRAGEINYVSSIGSGGSRGGQGTVANAQGDKSITVPQNFLQKQTLFVLVGEHYQCNFASFSQTVEVFVLLFA